MSVTLCAMSTSNFPPRVPLGTFLASLSPLVGEMPASLCPKGRRCKALNPALQSTDPDPDEDWGCPTKPTITILSRDSSPQNGLILKGHLAYSPGNSCDDTPVCRIHEFISSVLLSSRKQQQLDSVDASEGPLDVLQRRAFFTSQSSPPPRLFRVTVGLCFNA